MQFKISYPGYGEWAGKAVDLSIRAAYTPARVGNVMSPPEAESVEYTSYGATLEGKDFDLSDHMIQMIEADKDLRQHALDQYRERRQYELEEAADHKREMRMEAAHG